tara:strand:- start:358 stop:480 length:123 start_codon:yes stop_codon:yes gene_type:complete
MALYCVDDVVVVGGVNVFVAVGFQFLALNAIEFFDVGGEF